MNTFHLFQADENLSQIERNWSSFHSTHLKLWRSTVNSLFCHWVPFYPLME